MYHVSRVLSAPLGRRIFLTTLLGLVAPGLVDAQENDRGWFVGPAAGILWSPASVSVDGRPAQRVSGLGGHFGLEFRPFGWITSKSTLAEELRRLSLTPQVALTASHLRGIDPDVDSVAFAEFSILGARLAWKATDAFRVFGVWRTGKRTTEVPRVVGGVRDVDNMWGSAVTSGVGAHMALAKSGRGLEIAILRSRGNFEWREAIDFATNEHLEDVPVRVPFRTVWIQIGWSGPFTGSSLPWR